MINDLCLLDPVHAIMAQLAVLLITAAGLCVMIGLRDLAPRLLILGFVLAAGVGIVPSYQDGQAEAKLRLVQEAVMWAVVLGICAAVLGRPHIAAALIAPAILLFFVWPALAPFLRELSIRWIALAMAVVAVLVGLRKLLPLQERAKVRIDSDSERVRDLLKNARSTHDQFRPPLGINLPPLNKSERTARKHFESTWP